MMRVGPMWKVNDGYATKWQVSHYLFNVRNIIVTLAPAS